MEEKEKPKKPPPVEAEIEVWDGFGDDHLKIKIDRPHTKPKRSPSRQENQDQKQKL